MYDFVRGPTCGVNSHSIKLITRYHYQKRRKVDVENYQRVSRQVIEKTRRTDYHWLGV